MKRNLARAAGVMAALWIAGSAGAADTLFAYDGFDYAAGTELNGLSGGQGWADVWRTSTGIHSIDAVGLTYVDVAGRALQTSGHSLATLSGGNTSGVASRLSFADYGEGGTTVWISFLQRNVTVTADAFGAGVTLGAGLTQIQPSMVGGLFKTDEGSIRSGIKSINQSTLVTSRGSIGLGETLMHVLRLDFQVTGNDKMSLWRNPELVGDPGAPDVTASFVDMSSLLSGISLVTSLRPTDGITFGYDELRIGSSWAAVTPISAVPEPSAWMTLLAGAAVVATIRRQNRSA